MNTKGKGRRERIEARRATIMRLRAEGQGPSAIGAQLRISPELVRQDIYRVLTARRTEMNQHSDLLLADAVNQTESVAAAAMVIAREDHVKVSNAGRVVTDDQGQPVLDRTQNTAALSLVLRALERLAKLQGLDGAAKVEITNKLTVEQAYQVIEDSLIKLRAEVEAERNGTALPAGDGRTALDLIRPNPADAHYG